MIHYYGITKIGSYHVEKGIVCQDYHSITKIDNHFCIAAVADGVGSETKSDIASKIASESCVDYLKDNFKRGLDNETALEIIKNAFAYSLTRIEEYVEENSEDINQFDTTLVACVFVDKKVFYGNSGDSGAVVLLENGLYLPITKKQNDENGCVYSLCWKDKWEFGFIDNVASVLLATDGLYDTLFPFLLKYSDKDIYVSLAEYLMNNKNLKYKRNNDVKIQKTMEEFIDGIPGSSVNDDKTVVVIVDTSVKVGRQDDQYYAPIDWDELQRKHNEIYFKEAYPSLNKDE